MPVIKKTVTGLSLAHCTSGIDTVGINQHNRTGIGLLYPATAIAYCILHNFTIISVLLSFGLLYSLNYGLVMGLVYKCKLFLIQFMMHLLSTLHGGKKLCIPRTSILFQWNAKEVLSICLRDTLYILADQQPKNNSTHQSILPFVSIKNLFLQPCQLQIKL